MYLGWAPALYPNIKGFLHWGMNQYLQGGDPYERSCLMFSERVLEFHPKRQLFLPAGDFAVIYPGFNLPLTTQRAEAQRLGLEDLCLLETLPEDEREQMVLELVRGYEDYTVSIPAYRAVKEKLLKRATALAWEGA